MRRYTKNTLPKKLTEDDIAILVKMAMEEPKTTFDWAEVSEILDERGELKKVLIEVRKVKKAIEQAKEGLKSPEQKAKEEREWREFVKNADPHKFYGNMGEPTTPQAYKDKYGVWPPGYDINGNKI